MGDIIAIVDNRSDSLDSKYEFPAPCDCNQPLNLIFLPLNYPSNAHSGHVGRVLIQPRRECRSILLAISNLLVRPSFKYGCRLILRLTHLIWVSVHRYTVQKKLQLIMARRTKLTQVTGARSFICSASIQLKHRLSRRTSEKGASWPKRHRPPEASSMVVRKMVSFRSRKLQVFVRK